MNTAFIQRLLALVAPDRRLLTIIAGLIVLGEVIAVCMPLLLAWLLNHLADQSLVSHHLVWFAITVLAIQLTLVPLGIIRVGLNRRMAMRSVNRLRRDYFQQLLHMPYRFFLDQHAGGQANSYLNDIDDLDTAINALAADGLRNACSVVIAGSLLLWWNPLLGLATLLVLPAAVWAQRKLRKRVRHHSRDKVDRREAMVTMLAEACHNIAVVKGAGLEHRWQDRMTGVSDGYQQSEVALETYQSAIRSTASIVVIATQFAFFIGGALMVVHAGLAVGDFLGQLVLINRLTGPMNGLLEYASNLARGQGALHRVEQTLASEREDARFGSLPVNAADGITVELRDLHYRHVADIPLMEGWSCTVPAGSSLALVGASGCGKTTLFHLLLGLLPNEPSNIFVNGQALTDYDLDSLRQHIAVVFQDQDLRRGTVRDHLAMALPQPLPDNAESRYWLALEQASLAEVVRNLPEQLDTAIGDGGMQLSGGQRQRLAIAQALLTDSPLLLLDEATSALDSLVEAEIQRSISAAMAHRTTIIIAHRLSTIRAVDQIAVIDQGKIIEIGDHDTLLARQGRYADLHAAQHAGLIDDHSWHSNTDLGKGD